MRSYVLLLLMLIGSAIQAATYYVSNSGNDSNNGTTAGTAWLTIAKVNATILSAGDQVLFERGSTWYGGITLTYDGTSGNPITFGAYGTGANPIISGFTNVTAWTNLGGNIWESTNAVSTLSYCNMVVVNGVNTAMGRYPNTSDTWGGFLAIDSHVNGVSITDNSITGTPNWTGGELITKINGYVISRSTITSQSGSTFYTNTSAAGNPTDGNGYFIQNHIQTLDQQGEWYFNPTTKKISIYSTSQPTDVKVASVDNLFNFLSPNNIAKGNYTTIDGLTFEGANKYAIIENPSVPYQTNVTIQNCTIKFTGIDAIKMVKSDYLTILNNTVEFSNNKAMQLAGSTNLTISGNNVDSSGLFYGMGQTGGEGMFSAIQIGSLYTADNTILVEYNKITNTGHNPITFGGVRSTIVRYNFIDTFCVIQDDGGGIYGGTYGEIYGNIIINGLGNKNGNTGMFPTQACGIYMDDKDHDNNIHNNYVYNVAMHGIFINNGKDNIIKDNVVFNAKWANTENELANQLAINSSWDVGYEATGFTVTGNTFVAKSDQKVAVFNGGPANSLNLMGTFDNNHYVFPSNPTGDVIWVQQPNLSAANQSMTLAEWKSWSGQDANSNYSPYTASDDDLTFVYNADTIAQPKSLPFPAKELNGTEHYSSITLQPYTAAVLFKDLTIQPPVTPPTPVYGKYPTRNTRDGKIYNKYNLR